MRILSDLHNYAVIEYCKALQIKKYFSLLQALRHIPFPDLATLYVLFDFIISSATFVLGFVFLSKYAGGAVNLVPLM